MTLTVSPWLLAVAATSSVVALVMSVRLWQSRDELFFKFALSVLVFIPVLGPLFVFWVQRFPQTMHPELMDYYGASADVYERWRRALEQAKRLPYRRRWRDKR